MFPFAEQHVSSALTGIDSATPLCVAAVAACCARCRARHARGLPSSASAARCVALRHWAIHSAFGVTLDRAALISYGIALNGAAAATETARSGGVARSAWR
jgi:hypothetical protein